MSPFLSLSLFVYDISTNLFPESKGTYNFLRRLAGIAEGKEELMGKTPLESNQDFLQSISFHKGCYLGQELTARSNYTGIIRKRLFPCIFVDTSTQLPIPFWTSPRRKKEQQQEQEQSPIPFPRLGIADAAAIISVLQGIPIQGSAQSGNDGTTDENNYNSNAQTHVTEEVKEKSLPSEGDINDCTNTKVMETLDELETHGKIGSKIINRSDGRTVGEIVSAASPGTSVVIAQMRLEWLGMLKNSTGGENDQDATRNTVHHPWKITNKVVIGSGKRELRCLPYIPLWWPNINMSTGKGEEQEKD